MPAYNRETARDALAALFSTALVSPTLAQAVYNHLPAKFNGQTPVVCVGSGGTERTPIHIGAQKFHTWVYLTVYVFVLYSEEPGGAWTRALAEDRLDLLEVTIADVVMANRNNPGVWDMLEYAGRTVIEGPVTIGQSYLIETINLKARVVYG